MHLKELSEKRTQWLENVIHMAEEVMEYIDNWEPEDEDDELDEEALWDPVKDNWNQYDMLTLGVEFGIKDKEKEGYLEQIGRMASSGLLELVLPDADGSLRYCFKIGWNTVKEPLCKTRIQ